MVTVLYLIRHGETEGAEKRRYKGTINIPLSEHGIRQIARVSDYIVETEKQGPGETEKLHVNLSPGHPISGSMLTAVYCSDLDRAVKSAELIATPHSLHPIIVPPLRERNFGIWEGISFDEIKKQYPEEFTAWAANPLAFSPMGGESTLEVKDRAMNALDTILQNHSGERIAVVSHGGVIRVILCHILGVPLENIFRIEQDYAALNIIEFSDTYPVVKLINGTMLDLRIECI
jgi:alpha-ribazole phosphatase/probable phosphoglycerate mutase